MFTYVIYREQNLSKIFEFIIKLLIFKNFQFFDLLHSTKTENLYLARDSKLNVFPFFFFVTVLSGVGLGFLLGIYYKKELLFILYYTFIHSHPIINT